MKDANNISGWGGVNALGATQEIPMTKIWNMKKQLAQGKKAEKEFMEIYPTPLTLVVDHRKWDLESECGLKVELKTDTYNMDKTENFFMERWSSIERKSPGGPWQALEKGANTFIYLFSNNCTYFECLSLISLVKKLNRLTEKQPLVYIKNAGWTTAGYKVPRQSLEEHFEVFEWEE